MVGWKLAGSSSCAGEAAASSPSGRPGDGFFRLRTVDTFFWAAPIFATVPAAFVMMAYSSQMAMPPASDTAPFMSRGRSIAPLWRSQPEACARGRPGKRGSGPGMIIAIAPNRGPRARSLVTPPPKPILLINHKNWILLIPIIRLNEIK